MKMSKFAVILLVFLLALYAGLGCFMRPTGPPPEALEIFLSGDTKGELYKCG